MEASGKVTPSSPLVPIPVTVVSGGFGAGKTSVIRHLLQKSGLRAACLINDVADSSLDLRLLQDPRAATPLVKGVEIVGGCICCTRREAFLTQMTTLSKLPNIDHILVEACGVAEPLHLAENFALLQDVVQLDTMVTIIDATSTAPMLLALRLLSALEEPARLKLVDQLDSSARHKLLKPETRLLFEQVRFANVILFNQCDRVGLQCAMDICKVLQRLNPRAEVIQCATGDIKKLLPPAIIGTKKFSMKEIENDKRWFEEASSGVEVRCLPFLDQATKSSVVRRSPPLPDKALTSPMCEPIPSMSGYSFCKKALPLGKMSSNFDTWDTKGWAIPNCGNC